jgi:hypothetical protein
MAKRKVTMVTFTKSDMDYDLPPAWTAAALDAWVEEGRPFKHWSSTLDAASTP